MVGLQELFAASDARLLGLNTEQVKQDRPYLLVRTKTVVEFEFLKGLGLSWHFASTRKE